MPSDGRDPGRDGPFMLRALALAERGRHSVSPNPMVGCVIVRDGRVVGEGFHREAGSPHAEAVALAQAGADAAGATVYSTLEPCHHTGRTGPCTAALLSAGVARVVVAVSDPHPEAGGGADALRQAGVDVDVGLLAGTARRLNHVFFHAVATGRPFVVAKAAVSLDGRIAAADGTSQWLTGEESRQRAHMLRADADAVLVGSGTVVADDPHLTCRLPDYAGPQPLRVVLDRRGRVAPHHRVSNDAAPTLVIDDHGDDLMAVMGRLWDRDVRSVLIEGGAAVLNAFLAAELVDRFHVHVAPLLLGDAGRPLVAGRWAATLAEAPRLHLSSVEQVGDDALLTLEPPKPATDAGGF